MGITRATGLILSVVQNYGTSKNMTALTNASEAVATLEPSHGVVAGDYLEITSGWGRLNGRIVRAKTVSTNDVTLEGMSTSSTSLFPAGLGTGSIRKITPATGLVNMSQVKLINTSGGEQGFEDMTTLEDVMAKEAPTIQSPLRITLTIFDDPSLPWYAVILAAADAQATIGFRLAFANGVKLLVNAFVSVSRFPSIEGNMAVKSTIVLAPIAEPTRYAS